MAFINDIGIMGIIIDNLTQNVTGSLFLSLLFITLIIVAAAFLLQIQVEWTAIFIFPFLIVVGSFYSAFMPVMGVGIIWLALIMANNWWFK